MGGEFRRLATGAVRWVLKALFLVLMGTVVVGAGGLLLGLLLDGVGVSLGLQVGALVGAALGVMAAFGPGVAGWSWGPSERHYYRPGEGNDRSR